MRKQSEWLKGLKVEAPQIAEETFVVFPLTTQSSNGRGYLTLDEAVLQGLVSIPESGSVPEIIIVVKGEKPVLVVEGTIVVGGLQNRTVNISLLLEAGKEHEIPVSCVEAGRWSFRRASIYPEPDWGEEARERRKSQREFDVAPIHAHTVLRRIKTESSVRYLLAMSRPVADQQRVWSEVSRKLHAMEAHSPTEDETSFYRKHRSSIEDLMRPIELVENQVGALVAIGNRIVGLEVFDHPETWKVMHRKILSGYAADALERLRFGKANEVLTHAGAREFVDLVAAALDKAEVKKSPVGLGEHFLLDREVGSVGGFALVHEGSVLHLFAFPASSIRW